MKMKYKPYRLWFVRNLTIIAVWQSKSNEYIRKIHLITEEYDGETLSNNKENLIVNEYDGEILTNDEVNIAVLYRWRNTHERSENEEENDESQDKNEAITDGSM